MILLALLLALAIFSLQTLANPIAVPGITFAVLHFTAYTKNSTLTHPSDPSLDSSTAYNTVFFVARDDDDDVLAICTAYTQVPLWKDGTSYPCHIIKGSEGDKMWFSVGENLREVVVQKMWNWDGMYMTGTATQGTYWNGEKGGNMSVGAYGTWYHRAHPWTFEVTSIVG